ncbi:unnamed protein product [Adineta ricciae]|uniref:TFIID subunit TAF5 NTD2 domain-containing protein n=1 Tax=Adineta ricciae TaxID=249248 RepID=A0A813PN15_ADIRI|nr:unnamed protein product [Adineta ricciae]CAF1040608.1 unnamed protein product [Adineta ricciae]
MDTAKEHEKLDIVDLLRLLRSYNMKETEARLRQEYRSLTSTDHQTSFTTRLNVNDYFIVYSYLLDFIMSSHYQIELIQFLFPLFVHMYVDLIEHDYLDDAQAFYDQFVDSTLYSLHTEFFYYLKMISRSSKHLSQCPLTDSFRTSRFFLCLSMATCKELQAFIHHTRTDSQSCLTSAQISLLLSIFQRHIKVDVNQQEFTPSNIVRYQTVEQPMAPLFVHTTLANKIQFTRLYTGVLPSQTLPLDPNRSSVHCSQLSERELLMSYPQINYNRLPTNLDLNNIPRLGPHQLPSICLFTLKDAQQTVNCAMLSNDCSLLALGFQSSEILICSLNPKKKLHTMKPTKQLRHLLSNSTRYSNSDPILSIDTSNERILIGHTSAILSLAFEPSKQIYLLSGSQDCTIRLWHLSIWSCLVVYKLHHQPILAVTFASIGQIFASCGMDGLVCLWTIDKISPIRIYPEYGHTGVVHLIEFHPNSNYLASAHTDHAIHLWNIQNENALVRIFNGHRHQISALKFSPTGHLLASGCWNGEIIIWDIQNNLQIAHLDLHKQAISSIEFSPLTGTLLLISSIDGTISLWNCFMITKIYDEKLTNSIDVNLSSNKILFNVFRSQKTSIFHMRFSKENILYAIGLFDE